MAVWRYIPLLLALAAPIARGGVVFENFDGLDKTIYSYSGVAIAGADVSFPTGVYEVAAQSFTPDRTALLDSIQLMLAHWSGTGALYALIATSAPNTSQDSPTSTRPDDLNVLDKILVAGGTLDTLSGTPGVVTAQADRGVVLQRNVEYWVWLLTDDPATRYMWLSNQYAQDPNWNGGDLGYGGPYPARFATGGGTDPYHPTAWGSSDLRNDGFALRVLTVPEPSSALLIIGGLALLLLARRKRDGSPA